MTLIMNCYMTHCGFKNSRSNKAIYSNRKGGPGVSPGLPTFDFRDWISSPSKSQYDLKIAKSEVNQQKHEQPM